MGDFVRTRSVLRLGDTEVQAGEVFEVVDRTRPSPTLVGVLINGYKLWLGLSDYEPLTPFEAAVFKRLKEGEANEV